MPLSAQTVELLESLVAFESVSHRSVLPIADFVCDLCEAPDTLIERLPAGNDEKVNLRIQKGPEALDGGGLVLCGHLDVVPAGEGWSTPPFRLHALPDRWVGRGTCDMKGFVALALSCFLEARAADLSAPLALLLTCDEEVGSRGAQHFVTMPGPVPLPRAVWIGEPTGLRAVRLHKGHLRLRVELEGKSSHSGYPHRGINAIEPAGPVLSALSALRYELEAERPEAGRHFPEVPFTVLNVGRIQGGSAVNVVPESCRVEIGVRLLPGADPDALVRRIEESVRGAVPQARVTVDNISPPLATPEESALHTALCRALDQRETVAVSFSSDAGVLARHGFDCVLCGPGSIEVAHRPDEFLPRDEAARAESLLTELVEAFCHQGAAA
ncbi:MAG: acetylornithine deacetylase [Thermoanaerobaculia bacterium]